MPTTNSLLLLVKCAVYLFCCYWINAIDGASLNYDSRTQQENYLRQFGYTSRFNPDMAHALNDNSEQKFQVAVSSFQRFAGLRITGVVNEETRRKMVMPRCGVPDMLGMSSVARKRRYVFDGKKWSKTALTYRFVSFTYDLPRGVIKSVFQQAFKMWSDVSSLTFSETQLASADILISFERFNHGDRSPFDGRGGVLAHAFYPGDGIGGDAHFDDCERFTNASTEGINLLQVAVHELGHSLGLGHSTVNSSAMAPFYSGYVPNFRLDQDDISGITSIYGNNSPPPVHRPRAPRRPWGTRPPNTQ